MCPGRRRQRIRRIAGDRVERGAARTVEPDLLRAREHRVVGLHGQDATIEILFIINERLFEF